MFDGFEIGATLEVEEVKPMNDEDSRLFVTVLEEIRDNQKLQLDRQAEAIALQREQFALVQRQAERHERIQDRAENIQARSAHRRSQNALLRSPHRHALDRLRVLAHLPFTHPLERRPTV
jgi:hypothetical protein